LSGGEGANAIGISEGEVDCVVALALSEGSDRAGGEEALDGEGNTIRANLAGLDASEDSGLRVGGIVDDRAIQGDGGSAVRVSAELDDSLVSSAAQEGDLEGISFRINSIQEELLSLLFKSNDSEGRVIKTRLLVDRGDINGDALVRRDGALVINDVIANGTIVSGAIESGAVGVGGLTSRAEAKSGVESTRLVLEDLIARDSVAVVLQRNQDGSAREAVDLGEFVGQDRAFDIIATEIDIFEASVPPVLFTEVLLERAGVLAPGGINGGPRSQESRRPSSIVPDERRNINVSDSDEDLNFVGRKVVG